MTKGNELFRSELQVINVGLQRFDEALQDQKTKSIHVEWRPPAGGNPRLQEILEKLNS